MNKNVAKFLCVSFGPGIVLHEFRALFEDEQVGGRARDSNPTPATLTPKPKWMEREYVENTK